MEATLGDAMCENNEGKAYLIVDAKLFEEAKKPSFCGTSPFKGIMARMLMYFNARKKILS